MGRLLINVGCLVKPLLAVLATMSMSIAMLGMASAQSPSSTVEAIPTINEIGARTLGRTMQDMTSGAADGIFTPIANIGPRGRCAHTEGDGSRFTGTGGGTSFTGSTLGFSADECSILGSVQFDFTESNILGDGTLFMVGLFGGYTDMDVDFDRSPFEVAAGVDGTSANNESGIVGGYATVARDGYYGVVSTGFMFGQTSIDERVRGAHGEYDTSAYSVSGTVGKLIPITDTWKLDLRGGLQYVNHSGDAFTDSIGNVFGESEVSYWQGQISAGLSSTIVVNEMSFQPYVRAALATDFDYESRSSVNGFVYDFDSGNDYTFSLSGGVLANVSKQVQVSGEISFDHAEDEDSFGGKFGVKFRF
jgi:hypothetical protein